MSSEEFPLVPRQNNYPLWVNHEYIKFDSVSDLLTWLLGDRDTLVMSHKIFQSVIHCLENKLSGVIALTLMVEHRDVNGEIDSVSGIDIEIIEENFNHIVTLYVSRLLEKEEYETLQTITPLLHKYGISV